VTEDLTHFGFENGNRVPVVWPDPCEPEAIGRDEADIALAFLEKLTADGPSAAKLGQRVWALAFLAGVTQCATRIELAKKMKLKSASRITAILRSLPSDFDSLRHLKNRQKVKLAP